MKNTPTHIQTDGTSTTSHKKTLNSIRPFILSSPLTLLRRKRANSLEVKYAFTRRTPPSSDDEDQNNLRNISYPKRWML
ncbi:21132_t:CDS:2 [Rhizophagus irregularis]|nr:21132_t:CDS:2 [Rhizophagus irregularis]